jgi:hypothetical protein
MLEVRATRGDLRPLQTNAVEYPEAQPLDIAIEQQAQAGRLASAPSLRRGRSPRPANSIDG